MPKTHRNYKESYSDRVLRPTYNPLVAVNIRELRPCASTPGDGTDISDQTVRGLSLFSSIYPPPILTSPPTPASRTHAFTTTVFKGSVCSSASLHTRLSLTHIHRLLKIRDSHITSSFTWPFTSCQCPINFRVLLSFPKGADSSSFRPPSKIALTIQCSCNGYKLIVVLSASRFLRGRSVSDKMAA